MLLVVDTNTLWRSKLFEAISASHKVLGLAPKDITLQAYDYIRRRKKLGYHIQAGTMMQCEITMPPGWATKFPEWSCRRLLKIASKIASKTKDKISGIFITSPHYLPMVKQINNSIPIYYYCSDDYGEYLGWGGQSMIRLEKSLTLMAAHSFFVSNVLLKRAIFEYGVSPEQVTLIPNATNDSSLINSDTQIIEDLINQYPTIKKPIVGVVGAINERLDFDLLLQCASMPECGTLLMIGPVSKRVVSDSFNHLLSHPDCLFIGERPHHELQYWMQALQVALIPYRQSRFNNACSPMRLFDHMAAGRPIVVTSSCEQFGEFQGVLHIGNSVSETLLLIAKACRASLRDEEVSQIRSVALKNTWSVRAEKVKSILRNYGSI